MREDQLRVRRRVCVRRVGSCRNGPFNLSGRRRGKGRKRQERLDPSREQERRGKLRETRKDVSFPSPPLSLEVSATHGLFFLKSLDRAWEHESPTRHPAETGKNRRKEEESERCFFFCFFFFASVHFPNDLFPSSSSLSLLGPFPTSAFFFFLPRSLERRRRFNFA